MSTSDLRGSTRAAALLAALLLSVPVALTGQSAHAGPPVRPGKVTQLAVQVTKPAAAYRLATTWAASSNTTSYRVTATDPAGLVLDKDTVTSPSWLASVKSSAGTSVLVTVTPYHDNRRGRAARLSTKLPDLTAPTGSFSLSRSGSTATVTQTALTDDVSAPADVTRVLDWGDGTAGQPWTSGTTADHVYAGEGLWRPSVTLTDAAGNAAVVALGAVVVGDETAPTGSFSTAPGTAWATLDRVALSQLGIHDDFSADADIVRTVSWGDGAVTPWASGTPAEHVYAAAGVFTPSIELVDEAGNHASVQATPVTVSRDSVGPVVKLRVPRTHRTSVGSWRFVEGRATDAGTGVASVRVKAIQKRGTKWYAYRPATRTWVRAGTSRRAAWHTARPCLVTPTSAGAWKVRLAHLAKGSLVVKVGARDRVHNASAPLRHSQRLTRR
ncbi:Ig-like domain repeat protein [Nocardioides sp. MAHUQ-72]|uniref:Ig-like domain repeat protein n=1 Tax=unclassified Nocardioides TaxID=2615069 RepID=UPI0036192814